MLHDLFEKICDRSPERIALVTEDGTCMRYGELDAQANQLAHALLEQGIQPQDHIVFFSKRSAYQVAVILALSKIGAIYVPISAEHTKTHLSSVCSITPPKCLLLSGQHAVETSQDPDFSGYFSIILEDLALDQYAQTKPDAPDLNDQMVAYAVFSSGTTGAPKAIPIRHAGLSYWKGALIGILQHPVTNVLANTSIDFDAHIWEYVMAWSFGAQLSLTSDDTRKHPGALVDFMEAHHVSDATLPPATLRIFTPNQINRLKGSGLIAIYSTGEACTREIAAKYENFSLYNCYGPTEATFGYSIFLCALDDFHGALAPIGQAYGDAKEVAHKIVDSEGNEVANGEEGELWISSPYLTPGYLNAANTPFYQEPPEEALEGNIPRCWYKTADKFLMKDGLLYYAGRLHQLSHTKIRGQLVNIEGVEAILRSHPHIIDVCVVICQATAPDRGIPTPQNQGALTAYVVYKDGMPKPTIAEIRKFCRQTSLNSASIPAYFLSVAGLPYTSGKINRQQLATYPVRFQRDRSLPYHPPQAQDILEKIVVDLWNAVLNPDQSIENFQIGMQDEFFLFGGDSIKAMRLIALLQEKFEVPFPVGRIKSLETLTPRELVEILSELKPSMGSTSKYFSILQDGNAALPPIFLLPPVTGESALTYRELSKSFAPGRRIIAINSPILSDGSGEWDFMRDLATQYLDMIRTFYPKGPLNLVGWSSGGTIAYQIAVIAETERQEEISLLCIIDEPSPEMLLSSNNQQFCHDLLGLMQHLSDQFQFPFSLQKAQIQELCKRAQIEYVFQHVQDNCLHLEENTRKILAHARSFLLLSLTQDMEPRLNKTRISVCYTKSTMEHFASIMQDDNGPAELGWEKLTDANTTTLRLPGDHFSIIKELKAIRKITTECDSRTLHQVTSPTTSLSSSLSSDTPTPPTLSPATSTTMLLPRPRPLALESKSDTSSFSPPTSLGRRHRFSSASEIPSPKSQFSPHKTQGSFFNASREHDTPNTGQFLSVPEENSRADNMPSPEPQTNIKPKTVLSIVFV